MQKQKKSLSVALAVYNEECNLDACLSSVSDIASEIIVVDGGSTDSTVEIARKHHAIVINTDNPPVFHINKQRALDVCTGDWILQLDADETIPADLKNEIIQNIYGKYNGFYIPRKNYFWGHWMKKGGQYPDYVIRLIKKDTARFPCKSVHEQIEVQGPVGYLRSPMNHISYRTTAEYWRKADHYTRLTACDMKKTKLTPSFALWFDYNITKPFSTFLNIFFRHKGFLDGWYGFIFAYWSSLHFPIAYKKFLKL